MKKSSSAFAVTTPFALVALIASAIMVFAAACSGGGITVKDSGTEGIIESSASSADTVKSESSSDTIGAIDTATVDTSASSESTETADASETSISDTAITDEATASDTEEIVFSDETDSENPIVAAALALIGIPFTDGGTTPETGFDNSGFIYYVLRENGYINCPRQSGEQAKMGEAISLSEAKAGDLVYFSSANNGVADFGGIYIGGGKMIYCPMPGQSVKETAITGSYWTDSFVNGVSLS